MGKTTIQVDKEVRMALNKIRKEKDLRSVNAVIKKMMKKKKGDLF
jgi:predicted CopG family antitoxin